MDLLIRQTEWPVPWKGRSSHTLAKRSAFICFRLAAVTLIGACSDESQVASVTAQPQTEPACALAINDLLLTNGKILTVDENETVVSAVRIIGDRIVAVGDVASPGSPCTRTIDLNGRTVVPGLIDNHNHWAGRASRPGHHVAQLDSANSIADVLSDLQAMSATLAPFEPNTPGEEISSDHFVTSIGAFDPLQFAEARMPTLEELDTIEHPVFLSMQFDGPSRTNSAGKRYFGFVTGGALPATMAANILAGVWDQNAVLEIASPAASFIEEVCRKWLVSLLGLPSQTAAGFVTGATMANFTGLAAARHALLEKQGWNVEPQGLFGVLIEC